jgi:predicted DNA-binding protein (MmcQ/YjbR family)
MTEYADVPPKILARLRKICLALPEAHEQQAWAGTRWRIRQRTFAHVLTLDRPTGPTTVMTFRSIGPELEVLWKAGHPFYKAPWGRNVVGIVLDGDTDWDEVTELLTDSYCIEAPKKLSGLLGGPPPPD